MTGYDPILYILSKDLIKIKKNRIEQNTIYLNKSVSVSFSVKLIGVDPQIKHLAFM